MDAFCQSLVGRTLRVLCEGWDEENDCLTGRCYADSPDIDGQVLFTGACSDGDMTEVLITSSENGLLYGREVDA